MSNKEKKVEEQLPIFGKPVFVISSNSITNLIKDGSKGLKTRLKASIHHLNYFAADGIMVKRVEFADDDMDMIIVNKDTDAEMNFDRKEIGRRFFFDKAEAEDVAASLNESMKEDLHEIANEAMEFYHNIDDIIAAQRG